MNELGYPAVNGEVVTEAHARMCAERGHAMHIVDGVPAIHCPRCGEAVGNMLNIDHVEPNVALGLVRGGGPALYISRADGRSEWVARDSESDAVIARGRTLKTVAVRCALELGCTDFEIDKEF